MSDPVLVWILVTGVAMSAIALVGSVTLILGPARLERLQAPLVALAAGSMIGGALFHLLPAAASDGAADSTTWLLVAAGFTVFLLLEQLLHRHHGRHSSLRHEPVTYLILVGDGLHNLIGGMAIASAMLVDLRLGLTAWLAAALHEVPQELGDFGVLIHGGWPKRRALWFNLLSGLAFLVGGLLTYGFSGLLDTTWLLPFAAGNFLYIGASDLTPEVTRHTRQRASLSNVVWFVVGLVVLWAPTRIGH